MESYIIIGTAGHVDHGKTELVKALTGVNTDRLKEEKERGISIELGFAPLRLDNGVLAGIVDVPGHERFVKNMLAGAGGIDLVLLVVAADEGVMPQTREHLDIVNLLRVQRGVVAITKVDLVDAEWLDLVREDIKELLKGTRLENAPIVPVSVVTGEGLQELRRQLARVAREVRPKPLLGEARLPIDRVFTITGFGTVLTGTLVSGSIRLGDPLQVLPGELPGRVRSLQVHGRKVEQAVAGQRVAVNLTGVEVSQVKRGDVLVTPAAFTAVRRVTALLHLLEHAPRPLKNWQPLHFHLGTSETVARVRLLDRDELSPGDDALVQLELKDPVVAAVHDRFVIRHYSPVTTIGGGEVLETGGIRYRRHRQEVLERLRRKLTGNPRERLREELKSLREPVSLQELAALAGLGEAEARELLAGLQASGAAVVFDFGGEAVVAPTSLLEQWWQSATGALQEFHRRYPLRPGYPKEELRSRLFGRLTPRLYQAVLERWVAAGRLTLDGQTLALPGFAVHLNPEQQERVQRLQQAMAARPYAPPGPEEVLALLGGDAELLQYCLQTGQLVKLGEDLYFLQEAVAEGWERIRAYLQEHGTITVAEARDLLGTSRRYCLPFLEYLDRNKRTRRVGDQRVLFSSVKNQTGR